LQTDQLTLDPPDGINTISESDPDSPSEAGAEARRFTGSPRHDIIAMIRKEGFVYDE
jgi:hypothetical protein